MANKSRIMIADDDEKILFAFSELFSRDNYHGIIAQNGEEALDLLTSENPDIVFLDITMPKLNGLEVLTEIKNRFPLIPVIIITGYATMKNTVKAIQLGAFDYLTKPLDLMKVREVIKKAVQSISNDMIILKDLIHFDTDILERYELLGSSPQMTDVYKLIGSISTTPNLTSTLILGESGTGKELVARAIHNSNQRSNEPFIAINCAAFPETLLESELFGYEKGAFTGATDRKLGKFEIAQNGTIFLDEIANLSLNLQQKLLRVLQNREFERLGGNEIIAVHARFIAATNVDITEEIKKGCFREDLYYRLNVACISLPSLRERKGDIPILANYFLAKFNFNLKKSVKGFSNEAMKLLLNYNYPGNIRELQNLIERAVMLAKSNAILPDALKDLLLPTTTLTAGIPIIDTNYSISRDHILELFDRKFITELLTQNSGKVAKAANDSGMSRQNFQNKMIKLNIKAEDFRQR
ncbi:MAG: sigma-54 dependent transcriptional regulator [Ignavibacteria bacterium]